MFGIPFTFKRWDLQDTFVFTFYDVVFTHDFGIFQAEETYSSIDVNFETQELTAFDKTGANKVAMQEIKVQAI